MNTSLSNLFSAPGNNEQHLMPLLFLGHGNPMNAIEENEFVTGFRSVAKSLSKPKAVLCISAHWETKGTYITAMEQPRTIHDFGGFPEELFQVQYPAPGNPALAKNIKEKIKSTTVQPNYEWGLDHGAWTVLKHFFPNADIPVLQMSLDYNKPAAYHYNLAKELNFLRTQGVLIVGSGNMVHNLSLIAWNQLNTKNYGFDWAIEADVLFKKHINNGDHTSLIQYSSLGKAVQKAIPTPEHFLPLLYILALQQKNEPITYFNDQAVAGSLTMTSLKIGN